MRKHLRGMNTIRITTIQMVNMNRMTTTHTGQAMVTHTILNPTLTITEDDGQGNWSSLYVSYYCYYKDGHVLDLFLRMVG